MLACQIRAVISPQTQARFDKLVNALRDLAKGGPGLYMRNAVERAMAEIRALAVEEQEELKLRLLGYEREDIPSGDALPEQVRLWLTLPV